MQICQGLLDQAKQLPSPHQDERPPDQAINLLVLHNISLPPGQFDTPCIDAFFTGCLDPQQHPFFQQIHQMRVSAHCVVWRDGTATQYVPFERRAWHAGVSSFQGQSACNDYAIGIELEGTDDTPYTDAQYATIESIANGIMKHYPAITAARIVGHCDIAPGRKTDPGFAFDWARFRQGVAKLEKYK